VRITGGFLKGRNIDVPKGLPVRPTTAFASEALFNILNNVIDFEESVVLDLFSGTGHICIEFASRGCKNITAIDKNSVCIKHLSEVNRQFQLNIQCVKQDVFSYLEQCSQSYSLIFADPPYELQNIEEIHQLVFEKQLLKENGLLIIEHGAKTKMGHLPHFKQHRKYGNVNFSFFRKDLNP
jgi:16S rRNA (guanine966-N2)-methyltransferase